MTNKKLVKKLLISSAYGVFNMNKKSEIEKLKKQFNKQRENYEKKIEKLKKECEHEWETFRGYDGTDYICKICRKYE